MSPGIGEYSAAFGLDNQAGSTYSTAFGWNNRLRFSDGSLALGIGNSGVFAYYGVLLGGGNGMRGFYGLVGGYRSKVINNANSSFLPALVDGVYAPPYPPSLAFGQGCVSRSARGNTYTLGYYARTGGYYGSFVLADMSPMLSSDAARQQDSLVSSAYNQFSARFAGGYRLFTTAAVTPGTNAPVQGNPIGMELPAGGNAWQVISDSTRKERRVLADGNAFLARINAMRLGSWNYKGQSPDTMRHYGPMAQDFYAAFGHDGVGRSGNATSINQADFDGVNLIAIQALYRRVLTLEADNARLRQQLQQLQAQGASGPAPAASAATIEALEARLRRLEAGGAQAQR